MQKEAKAAVAERAEGLKEGEDAVGPSILPPSASAPLTLPSKVEN